MDLFAIGIKIFQWLIILFVIWKVFNVGKAEVLKQLKKDKPQPKQELIQYNE